jgi:hypothetical protein
METQVPLLLHVFPALHSLSLQQLLWDVADPMQSTAKTFDGPSSGISEDASRTGRLVSFAEDEQPLTSRTTAIEVTRLRFVFCIVFSNYCICAFELNARDIWKEAIRAWRPVASFAIRSAYALAADNTAMAWAPVLGC